MLTLTIILGSVREGRLGKKVADWVIAECKKRKFNANFIDPLEHEEILVFRNRYRNIKKPSADLKKVQKMIQDADAYIAITPEYNHSYTGAIKNVIDHFAEEYFYKCSGIVCYSNGSFGGIRAGEALIPVFKEIKAPTVSVMPIPKVQEVFDGNGNLKNELFNEKIKKFLDDIEWYAHQLKKKRP